MSRSTNPANMSYTRFPQDTRPNMQIIDPTYDVHVIRPNEENVTRGRIGVRYVIDSRDRDLNKYPEPNSYRIPVPEEYHDIISAQLVQAIVPHSPYNVSNNNNKLVFQETKGTMLEAAVPPGFYAISDLLAAIQTALNQAGDSTYTVTLIPTQNRVKIVSSLTGGDGLFLLYNLPGSNSITPVIGMQNIPADITGKIRGVSTNKIYGDCTRFTKELSVGDSVRIQGSNEIYTIIKICNNTEIYVDRDIITGFDTCGILLRASYTAQYPYDLKSTPYVILNVPEFHKLKSVNKHIDDAYAIIPVTPCAAGCGDFSLVNTGYQPAQREITYFNPPLGSLIYITIRFTDAQGNLYDFGGRDHLLVFELMALNQPGKYNLIGDI